MINIELEKRKELRNKELRNKELRNKELRNKELRNKELRNKELRNKELRNKELRNKELRNKELRNKELRNKELRNKELRNKELRNKELRNKELRNKIQESLELQPGLEKKTRGKIKASIACCLFAPHLPPPLAPYLPNKAQIRGKQGANKGQIRFVDNLAIHDPLWDPATPYPPINDPTGLFVKFLKLNEIRSLNTTAMRTN